MLFETSQLAKNHARSATACSSIFVFVIGAVDIGQTPLKSLTQGKQAMREVLHSGVGGRRGRVEVNVHKGAISATARAGHSPTGHTPDQHFVPVVGERIVRGIVVHHAATPERGGGEGGGKQQHEQHHNKLSTSGQHSMPHIRNMQPRAVDVHSCHSKEQLLTPEARAAGFGTHVQLRESPVYYSEWNQPRGREPPDPVKAASNKETTRSTLDAPPGLAA